MILQNVQRRTYLLLVSWWSVLLAAAGPAPVKLAVTVDSRSIPAGASLAVRVELQDASNKLAAAPKPLTVSLQARLASNKVVGLGDLLFAAGKARRRSLSSRPGPG
jgi:hypothetical protein